MKTPLAQPVQVTLRRSGHVGSQTKISVDRNFRARLGSLSRLPKAAQREHADRMTDRDDFLAWVRTTLYEAELALHNGDSAPRRALWSRHEPVSVLGAWRNAQGQHELDQLFAVLASSFSDCTSYAFEQQKVAHRHADTVTD